LRLKGFAWFTNRPHLWRGMTQGVSQNIGQNIVKNVPKTGAKPASVKKESSLSKPKGIAIER
jgi:hypothetical protein